MRHSLSKGSVGVTPFFELHYLYPTGRANDYYLAVSISPYGLFKALSLFWLWYGISEPLVVSFKLFPIYWSFCPLTSLPLSVLAQRFVGLLTLALQKEVSPSSCGRLLPFFWETRATRNGVFFGLFF